ncbi:hypothetical protein WJX72_007468 [[Myrmecia] bisecta]|uniref:GRIP domain-containing protein n=1 Tax=[Myrmecia] bisecta TaxID=41462 RepID=A0AAW1R6U5_9CHLO
MSSPAASPSKAGKATLPPSIANASLEELQKLFMDSLKKLRVRDKKIADLTAAQEQLQGQLEKAGSETANGSSGAAGIEQLKAAEEDAAAALHRAEVAEQEFHALQRSLEASDSKLQDALAKNRSLAEQLEASDSKLQDSVAKNRTLAEQLEASDSKLQAALAKNRALAEQLQDATDQSGALTEQLQSLKSVMRSMAEERDVDVKKAASAAQGAQTKQVAELQAALKKAQQAQQAVEQAAARQNAEAKQQLQEMQQEKAALQAALEAAKSELLEMLEALTNAEARQQQAWEISSSKEAFLEGRVRELQAQLGDLTCQMAQASPKKALVAAKVEKLGSPEKGYEGYTNPVYVSELERRLSEAESARDEAVTQLRRKSTAGETLGVPDETALPQSDRETDACPASAITPVDDTVVLYAFASPTQQLTHLKAKLDMPEDVSAKSDALERALQEAQAAKAGPEEQVAELRSELAAAREDVSLADQPSRQPSPHKEAANGARAGAADLVSERAALAKELADAKKKFVLVAKRKQQEYAKKVKELEESVRGAEVRAAMLEKQLEEAKAQTAASLQSKAQESGSREAEHATLVAAKENALSELSAAKSKHTEEAFALKSQLQDVLSQLQAGEDALAAAHAALRDKDRQWAEREAELIASHSSSGSEVDTLKAEREAARAAVVQLRKDNEAERERVKRAMMDLKKKADRAVKEAKKAEMAAAESRGKHEAEREGFHAALAVAEQKAELVQQEVTRLGNELKDYKARAHALLRAKDLELKAAKEASGAQFAEQLARAQAGAADAQREADEAKRELATARDQFKQELEAAIQGHERQLLEVRAALEERQAAVASAASNADQWKRRYEALEVRMEVLRAERRKQAETPPAVLAQHAQRTAQLEEQLQALQAEYEGYRQTSEQVAEAKDSELVKLLDTNAALRGEVATLRQAQQAQHEEMQAALAARSGDAAAPLSNDLNPSWGFGRRASDQPDESGLSYVSAADERASTSGGVADRWSSGYPGGSNAQLPRYDSQSSYLSSVRERDGQSGVLEDMVFDSGLQESALLRLAERQAGREEELAAARTRAAELEAEVADLQQEIELRQMQEQALKEALREAEREKQRQKLGDQKRMDMEYLKNIMLKLYEKGEAAALLPVVAMMLQFSPAELKRCQDALAAQAEAQSAEPLTAPAAELAAGSDATAGLLSGWSTWFSSEPASPASRRASNVG